MKQRKDICIEPKDFDPSRYTIEDPELVTFKTGNSIVKSIHTYRNDKNEPCNLFFTAPRQKGVFFSEIHQKKEEKDDEDSVGPLVGYQVKYPLTSMDTMENPTREEEAFKGILDAIYNTQINNMARFCTLVDKAKKFVVPPAARNAYKVSCSEEPPDEKWIKKLYGMQVKQNEKTKEWDVNPNKPLAAKFKLMFYGKGDDIKVSTAIYSPGDVLVPVSNLCGQGIECEIVPVFKVEDTYYGPHGTAEYGTSIRIKLSECNYFPLNVVVTQRMLPSNPAEKEDDKVFRAPQDIPLSKKEEDSERAPAKDDSEEKLNASILASKEKEQPGKKKVVRKKNL